MQKERPKDVWSIALEERAANDLERKGFESRGDESSIFFIGSQNCGKTTLLLRFLEREEPPKPTTALEYTFARKIRGSNIGRDVGHVWELGGGSFLSQLVEVPITADTLPHFSVLLMLDLSQPEQLWSTMEGLLKQVRQHVKQILAELKSSDPELAARLKQRAWKKFGEAHPDKDLLDPLPVPLAIVGAKYDLYQDFDPEKKKIISKSLRFMAHIHGASLHFFSIKSDTLLNRGKQLASHLLFGAPFSRTISMDHSKPLQVPAGTDALGQIGVPTLSAGGIGRIDAKNPAELWKQAFCGFFPQVSARPDVLDDPCRDPKYLETAVDTMRSQKDEELERYRRTCEKKARELARQRGQPPTRTPKHAAK